jgi:hypothetical protein
LPLRVAVLGFRDHFGRHYFDAIGVPELEHEALVVGCGLSAPDKARSLFRTDKRRNVELWQAVEIGDYHAAPVEDALQLLADPEWKWTESARHVLLTIGGRPPHPPAQGGEPMLPCKHRLPWENSLARLRDDLALECFAVLDRPVTPGYAEEAWRLLAARGRYQAGTSASRIARDLTASARASAVEIRLATSAGAASAPGAGPLSAGQASSGGQQSAGQGGTG